MMETKYKKLRMIGRGAYGTVCLCERLPDSRPVIIKQIPVETMSIEERQAALNEVKVLKKLQHPHIVEYYENFLEDKALMIVMEYMEGGTLFDYLQQQNGQLLEEKEILRIFVQMLLSLQHVHFMQILHRDLKTQNILLNKRKTIVKIGDFGISKVLSSKSKAYSVVGTPCYISPELCEGKPYNQKSDIWALGCVLYELATLNKAFEAGNLLQLITKIMKGNFAPISDQYSTSLSGLIISMLHLDPTKRPQINEILCNPIVINAYINYFTDLGKIPVANKVPRTISFSTDGDSQVGTKNQNGSEGTAKPSLKQSKTPNPVARGSVLPASVGICPIDQMALQSGYDITPLPHCIVYSWGRTSKLPVRMPLPNAEAEVVQVSLGRAQKAALTKDGRVVLWDQPGQVGSLDSGSMMHLLTSTSSSLSSLSNVSTLSMKGGAESGIVAKFLEGQAGVTIAQVACGDLFTACLTDRGILMTYGSGTNGCLGHKNINDVRQTKAKIVEALLGCEVTSVASGAAHAMALTNDHDLFAWGRGDNGRLGTGNEDTVTLPKPVPFPVGHEAAKVFCGPDASVVITTNGTIFACGSNRSNKLGLDDAVVVEESLSLQPLPPTCSLSNHSIATVSIGTAHSGAITEAGDLFLFGSNQFGQLSSVVAAAVEASPQRRQRIPPTRLLDYSKCTHVACGDTFTVLALADGRVLSWGKSARGRLGREVKGDSADPVPIDFGEGEPKFEPLSLVTSHGTTLLAAKPKETM